MRQLLFMYVTNLREEDAVGEGMHACVHGWMDMEASAITDNLATGC